MFLSRLPTIFHYTRTFIKSKNIQVIRDELVTILNQARCPDFARAITHGDDVVWSHISAAEVTYVREVFRY